jgi:hypothetical protein
VEMQRKVDESRQLREAGQRKQRMLDSLAQLTVAIEKVEHGNEWQPPRPQDLLPSGRLMEGSPQVSRTGGEGGCPAVCRSSLPSLCGDRETGGTWR